MKEFHGLVVVQPFSRAGSLKDLIHQVRKIWPTACLSAIVLLLNHSDQPNLSLEDEVWLKSHTRRLGAAGSAISL